MTQTFDSSDSTDQKPIPKETPSPKRSTQWGLLISLLGLAVVLVIIHSHIPYRVPREPYIQKAQDNLELFADAIALYVNNFDSLPPTLEPLIQEGYIAPDMFEDARKTSYVYQLPTAQTPPEALIALATITVGKETSYLILSANRQVRELLDEAKLNKILSRPKNAAFAKAYWANRETIDRPDSLLPPTDTENEIPAEHSEEAET